MHRHSIILCYFDRVLTLRLNPAEPLTAQLVRQLRGAIAGGELGPGVELPPVRQLASDLGINLNTVARAYRALQQDGLVITARGRGTRVTAVREVRREPKRSIRKRLTEGVRAALADSKLAGFDRAEVERIVAAQLEIHWPSATGKET